MSPFVQALTRLPQTEVARLRRLSTSDDPILPGALELEIPEGEDRWAYATVAVLYPFNPGQPAQRQSFAAVLRALVSRAVGSDVERRFVALLDSMLGQDGHGTRKHLDHAVRLAARHHIPIDWDTLLDDLRHWNEPDRAVQRRWAQEFWGQPDPSTDELTIPQIVETFQLGPYYDRMLRRIAGTSRLPARKIGGSWIIRRADIEHWLETRPKPGRKPAPQPE